MRSIFVLYLICAITPIVHSQDQFETFKTSYTKYRVSSKNCTKLTHISGSQIFIPEDAFKLSSKNDVDSVDVFYREIRSPLDILINNIPMTVNVVGKKYFLESNGMFEIWAISKKDTLEINEDKSIVVRLAMSPEEVDVQMEGYRFNSNKRFWESYTNQLGHSVVNTTDEDLWGSSPVQNDIEIEGLDNEWVREDSIRKVAFQEMEILDFGFYNYDKIISGETFVLISAGFVNERNETLTSTIYIVYEGINSVFYYPAYTWSSEFSIIKNRSYKMFTIDEESKVLKLANNPVLEGISNYNFKLITESKIVNDKSELASLIGIR